jgi:arylsulfatase A-like enzyme
VAGAGVFTKPRFSFNIKEPGKHFETASTNSSNTMPSVRRVQPFLVAALLSAAVSPLVAARADETRMNLLIVQTDEHHFNTLGCYGGKIVKTPNIDWIAKNGALCTSFYATTPVCSPSRAALVSGLYPQKTRVTTNNIPLDGSIVTFAEILRRRGYATGYAGKWHLEGTGKPQWAPKRKFGFDDNRFMFNRGHWKKFVDAATGPQVGARNKQGQPSYNVDGADEKTFSTDWLCNKAIEFIGENRDRPFCYMVSLPDPHGPNTVRAPYDTMYEKVHVPIPVSFRRKPEQIPAWGKPAGVKPAQLQRLMRNYYGMVKCIDDNVGKILDALRAQKLLDRTIVIFTSDHGDLCGEHGRLNKGVPYEGSARIPFLMYCPGKVPPGTVIDQALSNIDFLPTVIQLLDVPLEHKVDGRSAAALFTGKPADDWEDISIIRSAGKPGQAGNAWLSAVTQQYKLVYSSNEVPWLIDVTNDPNELTNLFGQASLKQQTRWMTEKLSAYGRAHNDDYVRRPRIRSWMDQVLKADKP